MFSVRITGFRNPRDPELIKLEIIFHKTGFARVPKIYYVMA